MPPEELENQLTTPLDCKLDTLAVPQKVCEVFWACVLAIFRFSFCENTLKDIRINATNESKFFCFMIKWFLIETIQNYF